jgi:hypothetical protein
MVGVAQLVEHLVVVQDVAGSSPVTHPRGVSAVRCRTPKGVSPSKIGERSSRRFHDLLPLPPTRVAPTR